MNEVLLYGLIWSQSSIDFINSINQVEDGELTVRVNSGGGEVTAGYGMIAKFREFEGKKKVKIDGAAYSMAAIFALYADDVEALDVSKIMFHRAAMPQWYEDSYITESEKEHLKNVNADFERAFRNKIDVEKFESIKGVKVKELFSMDGRIDVFLTAKEAKQIGLISKITNITPEKKSKINAEMTRIAANYGMDVIQMNVTEEKPEVTNEKVITKTNNKMTIEQLKAENPELFAQILAMGSAEERDRVGAWMKFIGADADAVAAGIASGKNIGQTEMADFTIKMMTAKTLVEVKAEGENTKVETKETKETELTAVDSFRAQVMNGVGAKTENN